MSLAGALVSLAAAVVSLFFTATVARKWAESRKLHYVAWTAGLAMFSIATLVQFVGELSGWGEVLFRTWYLFGIVNVGYLGLGSVYLANRKAGHGFGVFLLVMTLALLAAVLVTPTNAEAIARMGVTRPPTGEGWAASTPRLITPIINIFGAAALIGLSLYGLWKFRLTYNAYIAAGAVVLSISTGLTRFGEASFFYVGLFAGIAIMFVGFLKAVEWAKERKKAVPIEPAKAPAPKSQSVAQPK